MSYYNEILKRHASYHNGLVEACAEVDRLRAQVAHLQSSTGACEAIRLQQENDRLREERAEAKRPFHLVIDSETGLVMTAYASETECASHVNGLNEFYETKRYKIESWAVRKPSSARAQSGAPERKEGMP